jgi:hypothetical protein
MNLIIQNVMKEKGRYPIYEINDKDGDSETSVRYFYFLRDSNFILHKENLVLRMELYDSGECRTDVHYKNTQEIYRIWENLKNAGRHVEIKNGKYWYEQK